MFRLALRNLFRRPLRAALTLGGLSVAMAVLACLSAFGQGYRRGLRAELDHMGLHLMLVPLGCPYDAAARILKGKAIENLLPESALREVRADPAVAVAAPMLTAAVPRAKERRTDLWVGLDESALELKPWWRVRAGQRWFAEPDSVILGSEAAVIEMRGPGDRFHSPELGRTLGVTGILERSGTSDDSLFFVPLATAQQMLQQPGRLTAIAVRLRDPAQLRQATERLQRIPGAQVVTLTEMMGTFLNLVGTVRTLVLVVAVVAITAGALGVFNTLLAAVVERTAELSVLRALGASRSQVFGLIALESAALTALGAGIGLLLALAGGGVIERFVKPFVPLAPAESLLSLTGAVAFQSVAVAMAVGLLAGLYPAWQASRLPPATATAME
jgi:putative ABC transport system permease protein